MNGNDKVSRRSVFFQTLENLHEFGSENTATYAKLWDQATLDEAAHKADADIEEACQLIRRAKYRLGYHPEPAPDLDHPYADHARRIREAQTTLDLALEELGWSGFDVDDGDMTYLQTIVNDAREQGINPLNHVLHILEGNREAGNMPEEEPE